MADTLRKMSIQLLDLGKRNRLLNYKDSGYRGINVIGDILNIFEGIKNSKTYNIFKIDEVLDKFNKDLVIDSEENTLNFSESKVKDIAQNILKTTDLLCYKPGYKTNVVVKRLHKEYLFSLAEKGLNTLYITFGMINYKEGKFIYKAPLLLIPLQMELKTGTYKIHEYEDEIVLNPTLDYLLKTNYKVKLPQYSDEITLEEYFKQVSTKLDSSLELSYEMTIGIYSFLKMNMYNDIIENKEEILKNNNINVLLGNKTPDKQSNNVKPLPIVNCDSSQLAAIQMAGNGNSFVLEGPPGSGKSQTITNIIATVIGQNKKVLFVSEKLAALNVVYENLRRATLSDFAIEIHSHKANKKDFIASLYQTAILPKYEINDINTKSILENYHIESDKLSSYYNELHEFYPTLDSTLYEAYNNYLSIDVESVDIRMPNINIKDLNTISRLLDEFVSLSNSLGYDYRKSIFYGFKVDNDYVRYDYKKDLESAYNYLAKASLIKDNLNKELKTSISNTSTLIDALNTLSVLVSLTAYEPCFLIKRDRDNLLKHFDKYFILEKELSDFKAIYNYNKEILSNYTLVDKVTELKKYSNLKFKFLKKKYRDLKKEILSYRKTKCNYNTMIIELEELLIQQSKIEEQTKVKTKIESILPIKVTEYKEIFHELSKLKNSSFDIKLGKEKFKEIKNFLTDILINFDSIKSLQEKFISFSSRFDSSIKNLFEYSIDQSLYLVKELDLISNKIGFYFNLCDVITKLKEKNVMTYIDTYLDNDYELSLLTEHFKKSLYRSKIYNIIDSSLNLSSFTSLSFDLSVEEFKKLDEELLQANRAYVFSTNTKNRPNDDIVVEGSMFSKLSHEYNKQRKQKPIRLLLDEIFELAVAVKPIFLMSPLSVSMYLPSKSDLFDCVIFDEASQIFASDAFGSIYRAKQCIIIGDTKQMPPSNFFSSTAETEEDEYEDSLQSILDLASSRMLSTRLKWHYRSRSEELIAFSNDEFYDHNLITIPQAKKHETGFGIDFYYLKNGIYKEDRTNLVEANFITDMVINHVKTSSQSIGVIAFSNAQATLIENLIEQRRLKEPELDEFFNKYNDEPFFVKNLETVQGDERDVIIFSICYGYNDKNKFYQRFGPLNNLGGEKRLNVAITRAKYNIRIVSSILSTDINDKNTESVGVKLLKAYLAYAKNAVSYNNKNEVTDSIILSIKDYITSLGYDCDTFVGNSSFKVDLTVSKDDHNILAINLDNKKLTNLTDGLRLEQLLLERLGWSYLRVYSSEWINNREIEEKRIKEALDKNKKSDIIVDGQANEYLIELEEETKGNDYIFADEEKLSNLLEDDYLKGLEYLIKVEGPIHIDLIFKKVAKATKARVSNVLRNRVLKALDELNPINDGTFYDFGNKELIFRINSKLDLKYISRNELELGLFNIISNNNGITVLGCYKELIKEIGLVRLTEDMKKYLDDIIVYLKLDGKISQRNESLFV